jgi:hypothetical protein
MEYKKLSKIKILLKKSWKRKQLRDKFENRNIIENKKVERENSWGTYSKDFCFELKGFLCFVTLQILLHLLYKLGKTINSWKVILDMWFRNRMEQNILFCS